MASSLLFSLHLLLSPLSADWLPLLLCQAVHTAKHSCRALAFDHFQCKGRQRLPGISDFHIPGRGNLVISSWVRGPFLVCSFIHSKSLCWMPGTVLGSGEYILPLWTVCVCVCVCVCVRDRGRERKRLWKLVLGGLVWMLRFSEKEKYGLEFSPAFRSWLFPFPALCSLGHVTLPLSAPIFSSVKWASCFLGWLWGFWQKGACKVTSIVPATRNQNSASQWLWPWDSYLARLNLFLPL